jgi:hypothetical protein
MAIETVISAYNAARGIGSSRSDGSGSAEPDDLMKGRTFIPRMSEASRQALIEAMQKAKKNRQERLAKKKETGKIGSGLRTDVTEDQKTQADLGLEQFTSDSRLRGTYNEPSGTTGTGVKPKPSSNLDESTDVAVESNVEENPAPVAEGEAEVEEKNTTTNNTARPLVEDIKKAIAREKLKKENIRRFQFLSRRAQETTGQNNITPQAAVTDEANAAPAATSEVETSQVTEPQFADESKEKARGFLRNILKKKISTPVEASDNAEINNSQAPPPATDVDYSTAFQDEEEETRFTSIIEQGLNPTKEQNTYIPKEERTYQIQTGDRGFVKRFSSGEKEPAEGERLAETILAAIKGSIEGELPESNEELDNLVYGVRSPIMKRSDGQGRANFNLTAEAKYINAMTAFGIKDYPDFSELYRQVNGVEPPITSIGIDEFQIDTRYGLYNTKGEKIGVNGQSLAQSPASIIQSVFGSSFKWLEDKDKRKATNPEELASLIIDEMNLSQQDLLNRENELRVQWSQVQNKRVYNGVEDWVERGLEEFKGKEGKLKALNKYSAAMLKKNDLSEEDKELLELIFNATKIAIGGNNGFAYGGKIPYYKKKQTLKFR